MNRSFLVFKNGAALCDQEATSAHEACDLASKKLGLTIDGMVAYEYGQAGSLRYAADMVLQELDQTRCGCSDAERHSGHRIGCNWPALLVAAEFLRANLSAGDQS